MSGTGRYNRGVRHLTEYGARARSFQIETLVLSISSRMILSEKSATFRDHALMTRNGHESAGFFQPDLWNIAPLIGGLFPISCIKPVYESASLKFIDER